MNAVVYNKKSLLFCDAAKPVPTDNEVLIKVVAVAANAADYRSMKMGIIPKKRIFGADVAGIVELVGKNITRFKPGDEVIGDLFGCGFGGFAQYAVAPEMALIAKPEKLSFETSAAIPMSAITALQALRNKGNIQNGKKVLIVGSGGGVGTFAIQLANYYGADVTAICSTKNVEQSRLLGANMVIDYTKEDFTKSSKRYDLILAINGNYSLMAYKRILNQHGIYVMVGGALSQIFKSLLFGAFMSMGTKKMSSLVAKSNQNDLAFVVKLADEGKIKPVIDSRYTLDKTAEAMRYLSKGHVSGKVVIEVQSLNKE
jgi:NADPH:quinone reductase-like Zn-dependent oxidoreductase